MDMLNAYTYEADSVEEAVADILRQLNQHGTLKKNSAGFLTCSYDFVESGVVSSLCKALPFDVAGCTTFCNGTNRESGGMLLCLSVLTADDCAFATAITPPLGSHLDAVVESAWEQALEGLGETPVFALSFLPLIHGLGGELILSALDRASGETPIFGTTACDDDTATYANSFVIHNGECFRDRMALLLTSGNVTPRFVVASTADNTKSRLAGCITDSEGSVLKTVDDETAARFLESIGLKKGAGAEGLSCIPFLVDYKDGTQPVARAIYMLTEEGHAVCGGAMPKGSSIGVTGMSPAQILATAENSMRAVVQHPDRGGLILFPCLGRNMVMAGEPEAEIELVRKLAGPEYPWHFAYSGGEVCPVYKESGETVNRFHNFTFIACAF